MKQLPFKQKQMEGGGMAQNGEPIKTRGRAENGGDAARGAAHVGGTETGVDVNGEDFTNDRRAHRKHPNTVSPGSGNDGRLVADTTAAQASQSV